MPDLSFKYIDSVKSCLQQAGWHYKINSEDEHLWGKGIVLTQTPQSYTEFDPKTTTITLVVSTGKSDT